jgi:hypothetical protein
MKQLLIPSTLFPILLSLSSLHVFHTDEEKISDLKDTATQTHQKLNKENKTEKINRASVSCGAILGVLVSMVSELNKEERGRKNIY